jgi:hypothetical protein
MAIATDNSTDNAADNEIIDGNVFPTVTKHLSFTYYML